MPPQNKPQNAKNHISPKKKNRRPGDLPYKPFLFPYWIDVSRISAHRHQIKKGAATTNDRKIIKGAATTNDDHPTAEFEFRHTSN